jgi:hypothetical protein
MFAAVGRYMTGPLPSSGDTANEAMPERRSGYVSLHDVLELTRQQADGFGRIERTLRDELGSLAESLHLESTALRDSVATWRAETDSRLAALEHWQHSEEIQEALRNGRIAMSCSPSAG